MNAPPMPMLAASRLTVRHGQIAAVEDATLAVGAGRVVTVIGPNGAGKSTLLNALIGVLPAAGDILLEGRSAPRSLEGRVRAGMCLVPESRALFASMSVDENLDLGGYVRRGDDATTRQARKQAIFALFPRLHERRRQAAGTLSGGERQMLAIGRALMSAPRLLMLDEPSLGLAPLVVRDIMQAIAGLREQGVSILLVEQNARAALRVADYGYVLENGCIVMQGEARVLAKDPRVLRTYLGGRDAAVPQAAAAPAGS